MPKMSWSTNGTGRLSLQNSLMYVVITLVDVLSHAIKKK
jgi:hypothetical protein